jgi:putative ABC transport system substrate-binding protein
VNRRAFVAQCVALGAFAAANHVPAQPGADVARIGYLSLRADLGPLDHAFLDALRALGYVEGRNLHIEYRLASDQEQRLPALAAELVQANVDVIVTAATPAVSAAMHATRSIPIVMQAAADPVGSGFVKDLGRPGGNVTGMTILSNELTAKRLQLMQELVPRAKRVALLALDNRFATPLLVEAMSTAAKQLRLQLTVRLMTKDEDLPRAFTEFEQAGAQAMLVQTSPFAASRRERLAALAAQHRIPAMYESQAYVESGGLIAYGPDATEVFRRAAAFVDKIVKGARPGDLPIEQPTKFELSVNLRAAKALGLALPQSLLVRADQVIS